MFEQKVVWIGTVLGENSAKYFEKWFSEELGFHVKFEEEFAMIGGYEGIHCLVFGICKKEIPRFAMFRIQTPDMKWWEDFRDNMGIENIPAEIVEKYGKE